MIDITHLGYWLLKRVSPIFFHKNRRVLVNDRDNLDIGIAANFKMKETKEIVAEVTQSIISSPQFSLGSHWLVSFQEKYLLGDDQCLHWEVGVFAEKVEAMHIEKVESVPDKPMVETYLIKVIRQD